MAADEHRRLLELVPRRAEDYAPFGEVERWADPNRAYPDCSSGCVFARPLEDKLGADWVVCTNPTSHRVGLLTFEHQGCERFVGPPEVTVGSRVRQLSTGRLGAVRAVEDSSWSDVPGVRVIGAVASVEWDDGLTENVRADDDIEIVGH